MLASGVTACFNSQHQALLQVLVLGVLEGPGHCLGNVSTQQYVAHSHVVPAGDMTGPVFILLPRAGGGVAVSVHHRQLPVFDVRVAGLQLLEYLGSGVSHLQQIKGRAAQAWVRAGLSGHGTDVGLNEGTPAGNGDGPCSDSHAKPTRPLAPSGYGEGVEIYASDNVHVALHYLFRHEMAQDRQQFRRFLERCPHFIYLIRRHDQRRALEPA